VKFIDEKKTEFGVEPIVAELKLGEVAIAPSTYYAARSRPPSARTISDAATTEQIKVVHQANMSVYGARKVWAEMHRTAHPVARCTVERLMRTAHLRGVRRAPVRVPRTTVPGTGPDPRADLVERSFTATAPNKLWVADITSMALT